jgi:hypothetical protein
LFELSKPYTLCPESDPKVPNSITQAKACGYENFNYDMVSERGRRGFMLWRHRFKKVNSVKFVQIKKMGVGC